MIKFDLEKYRVPRKRLPKDVVAIYKVDGVQYTVYMDDYGQCYDIKYLNDGKEISWCCGTYNDYEDELISIILDNRAKHLTKKEYLELGKVFAQFISSSFVRKEFYSKVFLLIDNDYSLGMNLKTEELVNTIKKISSEYEERK